MDIHPDIAARIATRRYQEMLAASERARAVRDAGLPASRRRRRARNLLALARAQGSRLPQPSGQPTPPLPAA